MERPRRTLKRKCLGCRDGDCATHPPPAVLNASRINGTPVPLQNGDRKNSSEIKLPNNRQPRESTPVMCVRQNGVHNGIKVAPLEALVTTNDGVEFRTERVSRWLSVVQEFYAAAEGGREGAEGGRGVVTTEPTAAEPGLVRLTIVRPAKVVPEESSAGASAAVAASPSGESERAAGGIRVDFSERRSLVAVAGSGVGEWARHDFPRLLATVCDAETKPGDAVQNGASPRHQAAASTVRTQVKRCRLSLKANKEVRHASPTSDPVAVAPMFRKTHTDVEKNVGVSTAVASSARTPCVATVHNLGNTCFLSSVLQVLRYTTGFVSSVRRLADQIRSIEKDQEEPDEEILTWTLIKNLQHVYRQMDEAEVMFARSATPYLGIRPYDLLDCIERLNPMYAGSQQQDAHELLRCLLSYIQDAARELNARQKCTVKCDPAPSAAPTASDAASSTAVDDAKRPVEGDVAATPTVARRTTARRPGPKNRGRRSATAQGQSPITAFLQRADPGKSVTGDKLTMAAVVRLDRRPVARLLGVMAAAVEPVAALFRGAMELRTRCLDCDSATWRREDYLDIGVPVREEGGARDEEEEEEEEEERDHPEAAWLLDALGEVERLRDVNKYFCNQCLRLVEAERSMHYVTMPPILTLHLKRFAARSGNFGCITKVTRHVPLPLTLPCLQDSCQHTCSIAKHRYSLYAIVTHTGISMSSGHYIAYVRSTAPPGDRPVHHVAGPSSANDARRAERQPAEDGGATWYECDDDNARILSQDEFDALMSPTGGGSPYLLFYCQSNGGANSEFSRC